MSCKVLELKEYNIQMLIILFKTSAKNETQDKYENTFGSKTQQYDLLLFSWGQIYLHNKNSLYACFNRIF